MQKFQAYLKMGISTFKEQPFQTLQQHDISWEKSVQFYDIQDLSLMTLKPTETKIQWLKNQPKQNISEKPNRFLSNFRFEHLCSSAAKCSNPDHPELAPHCAN